MMGACAGAQADWCSTSETVDLSFSASTLMPWAEWAGMVEPVRDLAGVGANLQDHLDLFVIAECTGDHIYDRHQRPWPAVWAGWPENLFMIFSRRRM